MLLAGMRRTSLLRIGISSRFPRQSWEISGRLTHGTAESLPSMEGDAGRAGGDALSQTEKSLSGKLREKIVVFSMFHRANLL